MDSLKELRKKVKEIRASQKPLSKASAEDLQAEIKKHESAMKTAMRLQNLAKAREARKSSDKIPNVAKEEEKPKRTKKVVEIPKKEFIEEHKTLVKELKEAKPKVLKREAKKQEKELEMVEQSVKTAPKKKVSVAEPEPEPLAKHRR